MSNFIIVPGVSLTDAMLISTTVAEDSTSAWTVGTTYAKGDKVHLVSTHRVYESLQAANTGNNPATATSWWVEVDATNRWKLFDQSTGSKTTATGSMQYVIEPGQADRLSLVEVSALTAQLQVTISGSLVYDRLVVLRARETAVGSWYDYFYAGFRASEDVNFDNLPPHQSARLTLTLQASDGSSQCACGEAVFGVSNAIGDTYLGAQVRIIDYSRKTTSAEGRTTLTAGRYSRRIDATVEVAAGLLDNVVRFLSALRATPALFVAAESRDALTVYGFIRDWSVVVAYPTHSILQIQIEGLA